MFKPHQLKKKDIYGKKEKIMNKQDFARVYESIERQADRETETNRRNHQSLFENLRTSLKS